MDLDNVETVDVNAKGGATPSRSATCPDRRRQGNIDLGAPTGASDTVVLNPPTVTTRHDRNNNGVSRCQVSARTSDLKFEASDRIVINGLAATTSSPRMD